MAAGGQTTQARKIKKWFKISIFLIPFCVFFPSFSFFYLACGLLDVSRNKPADLETVARYFTGNGVLTWLLSPFNLLLDLISLENKGIYKLEELPAAHQQEVSALLEDVRIHRDLIKNEISSRLAESERGMLFFKWYGDNVSSSFDMPCFHKKYKVIKTIGVSAFNQQKATSVHFGPLRITLRVLYNLSPAQEGDVYIQVGEKKHHWKNGPLFIFDDTLQHQSVNYSDQIRHCMFIDIVRPTHMQKLLCILLKFTKMITVKINDVFYKKWVFLK